jgi:hypothetical protein
VASLNGKVRVLQSSFLALYVSARQELKYWQAPRAKHRCKVYGYEAVLAPKDDGPNLSAWVQLKVFFKRQSILAMLALWLITTEATMADTNTYHRTAHDLQSAFSQRTKSTKLRARAADPARDMFTIKVVTLGVETGGFLLNTTYFVDVQETPHPPNS